MRRSSEVVYERLRGLINSGELAPGAPIREEEVAELCGVSRTPVRDAISRLEAELFVQRTESQRTFVAKWSSADIEEVFTLRSLLESHAVARAAERATPAHVQRLTAINQRIRDAVEQPTPDVAVFLSGNAEFHRIILEVAASDRLATILNRLVLQPIVHRTALRYGRRQLERSIFEHEEITEALERGDPQWASSLMTAHIRRAHHVYAEWVEDGVEPD